MNGMGIIEKNDTETKAIFIEQEALEFARQNAKARKNASESDQKKKAADDGRRMAEKAEARRRAYNVDTAKYLLARVAIAGVMAGGWVAGLIHPVIAAPFALICLCTASERLGEWRAKTCKKEDE
jgi:hypothetical protein